MNNQYCLNLDFGSQGSFSYNVTTFNETAEKDNEIAMLKAQLAKLQALS